MYGAYYRMMAEAGPAVMVHCSVPLCCLGPSTRQLLAMRLDPIRTVLSPTTNRLQDWRGLAEMFGFGQIEVDNFERRNCPTIEVLRTWSERNPQASVGDILNALQEIERYDILHCDMLQHAIGESYLCRWCSKLDHSLLSTHALNFQLEMHGKARARVCRINKICSAR